MTAGPTVRVGATKVTPLATVRETSLAAPFGGLATSSIRPQAVEVRRDDGHTDVVRIPDPRRWIRVASLVLLLLLLTRRRRT